jgi:hypothetical protein
MIEDNHIREFYKKIYNQDILSKVLYSFYIYSAKDKIFPFYSVFRDVIKFKYIDNISKTSKTS